MKQKMTIHLASSQWDWRRFAIVNRVGFTFIGTVHRGLQVGALARDVKGTYYQVNGDHLQVLSEHQVTQALIKAREHFQEARPRNNFARSDVQPIGSPRESFTARSGANRN